MALLGGGQLGAQAHPTLTHTSLEIHKRDPVACGAVQPQDNHTGYKLKMAATPTLRHHNTTQPSAQLHAHWRGHVP